MDPWSNGSVRELRCSSPKTHKRCSGDEIGMSLPPRGAGRMRGMGRVPSAFLLTYHLHRWLEAGPKRTAGLQ